MADQRELVVLMTRGTDHELSSVGFTIANGGMTAGFKKVTVFLTSAAVDLARRRAIDTAGQDSASLGGGSGSGFEQGADLPAQEVAVRLDVARLPRSR